MFRKNTSLAPGAGSHFYILNFYAGSLLLSLAVYPHLWETPVNWVVVCIGGCVGALNVLLMTMVATALRTGPSGLTFAFQNASAVFPGAILYLLFGADFGFSCSYYQLAGIALVIYGLFIGTQKSSQTTSAFLSKWLVYALLCGVLQTLAFTMVQGRCILFEQDKLVGIFSSCAIQEGDDAWFMPAQFGMSFCLQAIIALRQANKIHPANIVYGLTSGLSNGTCTFLILLATKLAPPSLKVVLFPCFAGLVIILCNLWANRLFKEHFNLKTNILCAAGIMLGILS